MNAVSCDFPETLTEAVKWFAADDNAHWFLAGLRWPDGAPVCPACGGTEAPYVAKRKVWQCKGCRKQFSVKVGTIFEASPIALDKWMCAVWMIANCKNGISSYEIARDLGVTQKTGWFMLHRIRLALQEGSFAPMDGIVEVDESYIGAKARTMNAKAKRKRVELFGEGMTGPVAMTPVQGLLERSKGNKKDKKNYVPSRVKLKVLDGTKTEDVEPAVREYVLKGSEVHTDELKSYHKLSDEYTHNVINHAEKYVDGHVHTNGMENFWSVLKRTLKGTYVSVEPFHLHRYLDEQAFRFNERKDDDKGRFLKAIIGVIGKRLTWFRLTGKGIGGSLLAGLPEPQIATA